MIRKKTIKLTQTLLIWATLLCSLLFPSKSSANILGYNISVYGGPGFELNEGGNKVVTYGITSAYHFNPFWELGIDLAMRGNTALLGVDYNYFFNNNFFIGAEMGLDFAKTTTYYLGPQVGFDPLITPQLSIGAELQYLYTINDRGGILEALINFKYFFGAGENRH
jgi:hypothetical protein